MPLPMPENARDARARAGCNATRASTSSTGGNTTAAEMTSNAFKHRTRALKCWTRSALEPVSHARDGEAWGGARRRVATPTNLEQVLSRHAKQLGTQAHKDCRAYAQQHIVPAAQHHADGALHRNFLHVHARPTTGDA